MFQTARSTRWRSDRLVDHFAGGRGKHAGLFRKFRRRPAAAGLYDRVLRELEYPLILAALTATRGNQIKAADLLGLNRNTLRKKICELGVSVYRSSRPS